MMQPMRRSAGFAFAVLCASVQPQCFVAGSVRKTSWNALARVARIVGKCHSRTSGTERGVVPNTAASLPAATDAVSQTFQQAPPAEITEESAAEQDGRRSEETGDAESPEKGDAESEVVVLGSRRLSLWEPRLAPGRFGNHEGAEVVSPVEEHRDEHGVAEEEKPAEVEEYKKLSDEQLNTRFKAAATISRFVLRATNAKRAARRANLASQRAVDEERFRNDKALVHVRTALNEHSKHGAELFQHQSKERPGSAPYKREIEGIEESLKSGPSFVWWQGVFLEPRTHRVPGLQQSWFPEPEDFTEDNWDLATRFMGNGVDACVNEELESHVAEVPVIGALGEGLEESDAPLVAELQKHHKGTHSVVPEWTELQCDADDGEPKRHPAITNGTLVVGNRKVPSYYAARPGRWWLYSSSEDGAPFTNECRGPYEKLWEGSAYGEKVWGQVLADGPYRQQPVYVPAGKLPENAKFSQCFEAKDRPLLFARACEARGEYYSSKETNYYGAFINVDAEKGGDLLVTLLSYEANCCTSRPHHGSNESGPYQRPNECTVS